MKKLFSMVWISLSVLLLPVSAQVFAAAGTGAAPSSTHCTVTDDEIENLSVKDLLSTCEPDTGITSETDYKIEWGARDKVIAIANQIILAGSILSVGAIVYAAILYIISVGDDEKVKKAKGSLKFGIIGFAVMLISFPLVNAIIKLFYTTGT